MEFILSFQNTNVQVAVFFLYLCCSVTFVWLLHRPLCFNHFLYGWLSHFISGTHGKSAFISRVGVYTS